MGAHFSAKTAAAASRSLARFGARQIGRLNVCKVARVEPRVREGDLRHEREEDDLHGILDRDGPKKDPLRKLLSFVVRTEVLP